MPRKKKTDGKVIQFPQVAANDDSVEETEVIQPAEQTQQEPVEDGQGTSKVLEMLNKNRQQGLERMERAIDAFDKRKVLGSTVGGDTFVEFNEDMLRDVEAGIRSGFLVLEAINTLAEMLKHDLIGMIQNVENTNEAGWRTAAHHQTLVTLLKEKELITEDEMMATWKKLVPQAKESEEE